MPHRVVTANHNQMRKVIELATGFESETKYVKVDVEHCMKNYTDFTARNIGGVLALVDDSDNVLGGFGYIIAQDLHYPRLMAIESFWYVAPEVRGSGLLLMNAFERLAVDRNCDCVAMIHLSDSHPESLENIYKRKGYKLVEKHYVKEIKP